MRVFVDVIVPVHNASETIEETVKSAMEQTIPAYLLNTATEKHCCSTADLDPHVNDTYERYSLKDVHIDVAVCCQNDGSTDESLNLLHKLEEHYKEQKDESSTGTGTCNRTRIVSSQLLIASNEDGVAKGAGAARNGAASLRAKLRPISSEEFDKSMYFICLLDSDDVMHPHRIAHQVSVMLALSPEARNATLLGSTFDRIPADSTWHYTQWANSLSDERLMLERYREVTILQPTWILTKARFDLLGGYSEPSDLKLLEQTSNGDDSAVYKLIHVQYDTPQTLRLAEDLRLFHAHLAHPYVYETNTENKNNAPNIRGTLKLIRTKDPLMSYRHRAGQSQSSWTPRKLLLQLRVKAFTDTILRKDPSWSFSKAEKEGGFVIWGAGRDGKAFFKSLPEDIKAHVRCFVDVDEMKIASGYYIMPKENQNQAVGGEDDPVGPKCKGKECYKIPIVHFSLLARDDDKRRELMDIWINGSGGSGEHNDEDEAAGRINKRKPDEEEGDVQPPPSKRPKIPTPKRKRKLHAIAPKKDKLNHEMLERNTLASLPVVVCVAMYRTNGVLENNVKNIGRTEGVDLWHFI